MDNPFKKIEQPLKEVPKDVKEKVLAEVSAFKFFLDLTSLFSSNYAQAAEAFFKKRKNKIN